ncbi:MAG: DUF4126 domain-containing protein [Xanthomonadales bacterium]|nr:DUF4126 domain-containing protein [Xanthomonadales bacterium]
MALIHSVLMGAVGGMRAMTPLAAIANATRTGVLPRRRGTPRWLAAGWLSAAAGALALAEMAGDKMRTAPDRTVVPGLLGRCATTAIAGAALAPPRQRKTGAVLAAATSIGAAFATLALRRRAMRRHGQVRSGAVEDAITAAAAALVVAAAARARR